MKKKRREKIREKIKIMKKRIKINGNEDIVVMSG